MSARQRASGGEVRKPTATPLFPRYIFMHADRRDPRIHTVFELSGVGGLVCRDGAPVWMPDPVIAGIRSRENGNGIVPGKESMRAVFRIGDEIRVTDGPFASFPMIVERGLDVAIEEFDPETRIKVVVNIFGRATPVELEIWQVAKSDQ
jgi:transcriptional antiterminator NusG